jgi:predicted PurR-regulated permease PerM
MSSTSVSSPADWPPQRTFLATLVLLGIAAAFWFIIQLRVVFFSLFVAIVISTAITPVVQRLTRLGLSIMGSMVLVSLILFIVLVGLIFVVAPLISQQWDVIADLLKSTYQNWRTDWLTSNSVLLQRLARTLPTAFPLLIPSSDNAQADPLGMAQQVFSLGGSIFHTLFLISSVLLLTGLWIIEGEVTTRMLIMLLPAAHRDKARSFWEEMQKKVGAYTRGLALLLAIVGGLAAIAYAIIGLPNVLLLGLIAGIMEIVPLIGPALGAIPALAVAASTDSHKVIWVLLAYVLIQIVESNFIVPRVMDRTVGVNPIVSLLAFIAFGAMFGFIGAVLAVPLAAVVQLIFTQFVFKGNSPDQIPTTGRNVISTLRYEAQDLALDVRKQIRDKQVDINEFEDQFEDELETILTDLDSLLAQSEATLQTETLSASDKPK